MDKEMNIYKRLKDNNNVIYMENEELALDIKDKTKDIEEISKKLVSIDRNNQVIAADVVKIQKDLSILSRYRDMLKYKLQKAKAFQK